MSLEVTNGEVAEQNKAIFQLKEWELLRSEVEHRSQEQRGMERNVVILTAGVFTFLLSKELNFSEPVATEFLWLGWLIPPFVSYLALTRWLDSLQIIKRLAQYVRSVEIEFNGPRGGWEEYLRKERGKYGRLRYCSAGSIFFWAFIIGVPSGIAFYRLMLPQAPTSRWIAVAAAAAAVILSILIVLFRIDHAELDRSRRGLSMFWSSSQ